MVAVSGYTATGYERVQEVFAESFSACSDVGAAVCLYVHGVKVVDCWAGLAMERDLKRGLEPVAWREDTLVNVYSCSKAMANLCIMHLVGSGRLAYSDAVARHWPEFGSHGKEAVTVEQLLTHQAGLCYLDGNRITQAELDEWTAALLTGSTHAFSSRLAQQAPIWPLSHGLFGYHPLTIGFYVSELVRRVDPKRRGLQQYMAEEIAAKHGIEFFFGLPRQSNSISARVARLYQIEEEDGFNAASMPRAPLASSMSPPSQEIERFSPYRARHAELPSAIGFCTARALATAAAHLAAAHEGVTLPGGVAPFIPRATAVRALEPIVEGTDQVQQQFKRMARCGLFCVTPGGPHVQDVPQAAVYHAGSGGSLVFCDPLHGIAMAYTPNALLQARSTPGCSRSEALVRAAYECSTRQRASL